MKEKSKKYLDIFIRYSILIIFSLFNLQIFYFIFKPLTIYPLYFLLSLFFDVSLINNVLLISNQFPIEIIGACVAGSAYFLLLILNLSVPKINLKKRIHILIFSFILLLILNIARIFFLSLIFLSGNSLFDTAHKIFWYLGSTIFVIGIWFLEVKIFKLKEIPFYSDIKFLYKSIKK
jgi:exosortase/archaeosortase family protein